MEYDYDKIQKADSEQINSLEKELQRSRQTEQKLRDWIESSGEEIGSIVEDACNSRVYRLAYLAHRFNQQGRSADPEERSAYKTWIRGRLFKSETDFDDVYHPFRRIKAVLDSAGALDAVHDDICENEDRFEYGETLDQEYSKSDVIILSVIDYFFRHQRPQHFAERFAADGHRVFYINATLCYPSAVEEVKENLFIVNLHYHKRRAIYETDFSTDASSMKRIVDDLLYKYCIRDAVVIIDYPNWVHAAEYLRVKYGFKTVVDYMDDFTGFLATSNSSLIRNCKIMLGSADLIVASSAFLLDIASRYSNNCVAVRNGTEFEHFLKARRPEKSSGNRKKVIGYYGAIAHWFDYQKVCYTANRFPECRVVLIGAVTEWEDELRKCPNIELLGEKPYKELPEHLREFDVCLIPFDTSTDLIKATNPVKFYEYLSAGKKIVATEIPELEPYRDKYVYMANDNETFCGYVEKCLTGTDQLSDEDSRVALGQENDWQSRYQAFSDAIFRSVPKASIVIVTYNNLAYNRAVIDSILHTTAYENYEIIIVDNCSTDGTREWLTSLQESNLPNIKVILNDTNAGFAAGNNLGIRQADGDYIILLNNDTLVTRGWLTNLIKHCENDNTIGMVGAVTNSIGNEAMIPVRYHSISEMNQFAYQRTWEYMGEGFEDESLMLAMFCVCIPKEVISKVGLLDERYGLGMYEDDDYAENLRRNGYRLRIAEDVFIHHFQSLSFKKLENESLRLLMEENRKKYESKWGVAWNPPHYRKGIKPEMNMQSCIDLEKEGLSVNR